MTTDTMLPAGPVVVIGQVGRDVVVLVDELPGAGASADVRFWWEGLGGKGANQAVGMCQLGEQVSLLGVVGADAAGGCVLAQAAGDGIDISHVVRRHGTAALLDVVDGHGTRRLFERIPDTALVRRPDIDASADLLRGAGVLVLQLQQPADALLHAAQLARAAGASVVLDGGVEGGARDELLEIAHVVRADPVEAAMLAGHPIDDRAAAQQAAAELLAAGPRVVALTVADTGDLVGWSGGHRLFAYSDDPVADPTGGGDAFVAGLVSGLRRGDDVEAAGGLAAAAAASTVRRVGGRPDLTGLA